MEGSLSHPRMRLFLLIERPWAAASSPGRLSARLVKGSARFCKKQASAKGAKVYAAICPLAGPRVYAWPLPPVSASPGSPSPVRTSPGLASFAGFSRYWYDQTSNYLQEGLLLRTVAPCKENRLAQSERFARQPGCLPHAVRILCLMCLDTDTSDPRSDCCTALSHEPFP